MKIPLRERKYARTRLRLAQALRERLEGRPLEALAVRELCEAAEISEATFFNYFPRKADLLAYVGQLWSLELNWHAMQRQAAGATGLEVIQTVFEQAARQVQGAPGAFGELIAQQAAGRTRRELPPLTPAERQLAFVEHADIGQVPDQGLEVTLAQQLQRAIDAGALPPNSHLQTLMVSLIAIFYGVILALRQSNPAAIGSMYRQQLALLWAGVSGLTGGVASSG
ncbi:TetR family transcriptional regulator [Thiohalobacter sp. IOR34]|uniref:TetR/AcrR family transcriptional regulator n=1 Tax=Thiohalobacter sp. IOR34 TaxID=3057176 RepID=UPI0025B190E6|nr:TetR family transcriptional regulator [Thiohalobacter sp. IOR34]WJW75452.1 TetR family transcriptional regulator [Thiohalobacter sp. IOR34]